MRSLRQFALLLLAGQVTVPAAFAQLEFEKPMVITDLNGMGGVVWGPSLSPDGTELYFTNYTASGEWDIHRAVQSGPGTWVSRGAVPSIATAGVEDNVTFTPDGLTMIYGHRAPGQGNFDLWMTQRTDLDSPWGPPSLVPNINTDMSEGAPSLSADGLALYFGGGWKVDGMIMVSTRETLEGAWKPPSVLPGFDDVSPANYPAISPDGLNLVYHRGRSDESDLWIASRSSLADPFANHTRLPNLINSGGIDTFASLTDDALYYTRNASQGGCCWQLYRAEIVPEPHGFAPLFLGAILLWRSRRRR